jgi:serine/threonine protein kinase
MGDGIRFVPTREHEMATLPVTHPSADVLRAFALGKLNESAAAALMSHLDGCPDCCKQLAVLSGDDSLNRLRQARSHSSTSSPVKALSVTAGGAKPSPSSSAIANLPPELANNPQYQIVRELGRGGMGVVYLAKNKLMDRFEVLKVVNKVLLDHPGAVERFLREIRSAAKLSHANVVGAYSAVQHGELLAFAMEYVEGQDLASLVKSQGPLSIPHACFYVQQAAWGLQHAFEKGMVHRDIKPQNLILAREGKKHIVKVLDFGLAKATREKSDDTGLTGEGKMLGTPDYIAPEQTLDAAKADIRADIYSLGCTLYYLLSGHPPFSAASLGAVLLAHQMQEAKPLNLVRPEVPEELAAVVRRMMAKSPAKRYQTPLEVVQALAPFVKQGATAKPSSELSAGTSQAKPAVQVASSPAPPPAPVMEAPKPQPKPVDVWGSLTDSRAASVVPKKSGSRRLRSTTVRERSSPKKWLIGGGISVSVLLLALLGMWAGGMFEGKVQVKTKDGILVIEVNEPNPEVLVDGETATVSWHNGGKKAEIRVQPGKHKVVVKKDGFTVVGHELTFKDGDREVFTARLLPEKHAEKTDASPTVNVPANADAAKPVIRGPRVAKADVEKEKDLPKAETPKPDTAKPPRTKDLLQKDSVWRGVGEYTVRGLPGQPQGKWNCVLRITGRTEDQFKGVYEFEDGSKFASIIEGAVGEPIGATGKRKIGWKHVQDIKGDANQRRPTEVEGTMEGAVLDVGFSHRDRNTGLVVGSGVARFRIDEGNRLTDKPSRDGFLQLFNGNDLTGWKTHPKQPNNWKVEDGILIGSGPMSHLFSERGDYENFHFLVEAMISDRGNSGQYFRAQFGPGFPAGYEAQINSTHPDPKKTGSLYGIANVTEQLHKPNEWFTQEVIAQGDHIVIKVNDKTVVDKHDSRYKKGHFVLQQHDSATVVKFRKIEVKELPGGAASSGATNRLPPEAKEAARAYEKACAEARAKFLAEFDTAVERLTRMKGPPDQRLQLIEAVKAEKKRFEDKHLIPWSEPMRPYLDKYFILNAAAEERLRRAYNSIILAQHKAKNESVIPDLQADLANLLRARIVARWRHFVDGKPSGVGTLYSNWKTNNPNGNTTWSYANGVLIYRWPNSNMPGGLLIDTLNVSADGTTYAGTNNNPPGRRPKVTGVYQND